MTKLPPIAILAGGLATRLYPITHTIPKSLVIVAGKPFIEHQLKLLKSYGAEEIVLCVGNMSEQIVEFVGDGGRYGLKVKYSHDGETRLGTGGAIKKALPILGKIFLVTYGDSYLETPLSPIVEKFQEEKKEGLMVVYKNKGKYDNSNVVFANDKIIAYGKKKKTPNMHHIDYGIGVLTAVAFDQTDDGPLDLADMYSTLVKKNQLAGFEVYERFYEVGSHSGLTETDAYLANK
mgnify:FL=1